MCAIQFAIYHIDLVWACNLLQTIRCSHACGGPHARRPTSVSHRSGTSTQRGEIQPPPDTSVLLVVGLSPPPYRPQSSSIVCSRPTMPDSLNGWRSRETSIVSASTCSPCLPSQERQGRRAGRGRTRRRVGRQRTGAAAAGWPGRAEGGGRRTQARVLRAGRKGYGGLAGHALAHTDAPTAPQMVP